MIIWGARFAIVQFFRMIVMRIFRVHVRSNDDELELADRGKYESRKKKKSRSETRSSERGDESEDDSLIIDMFGRANSGDSISWSMIESSTVSSSR